MNRKLSHFLVRTGVYIMIATVIQQARSSQLADIPSAEQATLSGSNREKAGTGQIATEETVNVIHPEKSGAATLQLPGQLSAYTDAPIYAQTSGYLESWAFDIGAK